MGQATLRPSPPIRGLYSFRVKILVVEDEATAAAFLTKGLSEEGYLVEHAPNSTQADELMAMHEFDLVLLDVMIPGEDGFSLCRKWRQEGNATPIIFLTARGDIDDRVDGLDIGGDDYLVKPYAFEELLARVRMLLRRGAVARTGSHLVFGHLTIDMRSKTAVRDGRDLKLTAKEYQILEYLALRPGQVVTRTMLWEHVWESYSEPDSNVVDVYVGYLRNKLGRDLDLIQTRRGVGYVFGDLRNG